MKKYLVAISMIALSTHLFAQSNNPKGTETPASKINGTYQLEIIGRQNPLIPANLHQIVTENRKENQLSYVQLGTMVRVKILPFSEINSPSFKPLKEEFVNVESFK